MLSSFSGRCPRRIWTYLSQESNRSTSGVSPVIMRRSPKAAGVITLCSWQEANRRLTDYTTCFKEMVLGARASRRTRTKASGMMKEL